MQLPQDQHFVTLPSERLIPDSYVTDGKRLLRVVSRFEADAESTFASLEDCMTLEVRPYSPGELSAMMLQTVRAPVPGSGRDRIGPNTADAVTGSSRQTVKQRRG